MICFILVVLARFSTVFMNQLLISVCMLFSLALSQEKVPDISGVYKLVKGNGIYYDDKSATLTYIRGALFVDRLNDLSYAYNGALTPKGFRTVGRTGIYEYKDRTFVAEFPNGEEPSTKSDITFRNDSLFVISRSENGEDSLVWKRVPAAQVTDKYLLKAVDESRKLFELQKGF